MDAVRSRIVVYGGRDIVFDSKTSNQWIQCMKSHSEHSTQWMQYTVDAVHSGCSMQWTQYAVDAVHSGCSGIVVYGGGDIVFDSQMSNQSIQCMQSNSGHSTQWTQYAVDAVRSMQYAVCSMQYAVE